MKVKPFYRKLAAQELKTGSTKPIPLTVPSKFEVEFDFLIGGTLVIKKGATAFGATSSASIVDGDGIVMATANIDLSTASTDGTSSRFEFKSNASERPLNTPLFLKLNTDPSTGDGIGDLYLFHVVYTIGGQPSPRPKKKPPH